jgi:hypothetical protein
LQERYAVAPLNVPNYGPCLIEDFVPVSDNRALVTAGKDYRHLCFILYVSYRFTDRLELSEPAIVHTGTYLRLGHLYGSDIIYSDGWKGPHQPFKHKTGYYYSDGAPAAKLYRDGKVLIDHWDGLAEVGNPWVDDHLWFEARHERQQAPQGWGIYRADLDGTNRKFLFVGANPCTYKDTLYYGLWNGEAFDIAVKDRRHCLPADPYLHARSADADRRPQETA